MMMNRRQQREDGSKGNFSYFEEMEHNNYDSNIMTKTLPTIPNISLMNENKVYMNQEDKRFVNSNTSTQDTLLSRNTQLTNDTFVSGISQDSNSSYQSSQKHYSRVKIGHRYSQSTSTFLTSNSVFGSSSNSSVSNRPKSDMVLVNNLPYPTKLIFPAKISANKTKTSDNKQIQPIDNSSEYEYPPYHSYDTLIEVIESYTY